MVHRLRSEVCIVAIPTIVPVSQHKRLPVTKGSSVNGSRRVGLAIGWLEDETYAPSPPFGPQAVSPHMPATPQFGWALRMHSGMPETFGVVINGVVWCCAMLCINPPHHITGR